MKEAPQKLKRKLKNNLMFFLLKYIIISVQNKLNQNMHIANQPPQQINYYVQYQPMPTHLNQAHSNVHIYHRAEPSINMNKMNTEMDANRSRGSIYEYQNEQISFRKDLGKNTNYNTDSSVGKYATIDYTNPQLNQPNGSRPYFNSPYDNTQRNKSLFQVKRKQSSNNSSNSREIREQYYKNPQSQELLNKLPQLQFQHIHKVNTSRPYYASPTSDLKVKEQKKASSPFNLHTRSSSFKQAHLQGLHAKKADQEETEQVKKMKETLKFNSPSKNNYQSKTLEANKWINPYSERNLQNTIKKEYTPQTSNSTSTTFDTPVKPTSASYKQSYPTGYGQNNQKNQNCSNAHQPGQSQELKKQIIRYMELNKKLQQNLDQQKILTHQKEVKIKNLQVQITTQKINFEKKLQSVERDFVSKKEATLNLAKQQYEKQISQLSTQLSEKSIKEGKEIENKYQRCIDQLKQQIQKQKIKFALTFQDQQKRITERILKNSQLQSANKSLQNKISQLQEELKKKSQEIAILIGKNQQMKQKLGQPKSIGIQNQQNKAMDQAQKIKTLEQKNAIYLINIDKISQKYKDTKAELEKMLRRSEELNGILCEKDNVIRNMGRDLRNKDKFISELKKSGEAFEKIIKSSNQNLVKLSLKSLNQKYRQ